MPDHADPEELLHGLHPVPPAGDLRGRVVEAVATDPEVLLGRYRPAGPSPALRARVLAAARPSPPWWRAWGVELAAAATILCCFGLGTILGRDTAPASTPVATVHTSDLNPRLRVVGRQRTALDPGTLLCLRKDLP